MTEIKRNILVTGGAGFIGSNFVNYMVTNYPSYQIFNLDKLTYAGTLDNLKEVENKSNYTFIKGDIKDDQLVHYIFEIYNMNEVINLDDESHVYRSIIDTNPIV